MPDANSTKSDPLETLRLFADMRQSALKLRGLDTPDKAERARLIRQPDIHHALIVLLQAAQKLVSGPDEDALFWHPARETLTAAEKRFEKLRQTRGGVPAEAGECEGVQ